MPRAARPACAKNGRSSFPRRPSRHSSSSTAIHPDVVCHLSTFFTVPDRAGIGLRHLRIHRRRRFLRPPAQHLLPEPPHLRLLRFLGR